MHDSSELDLTKGNLFWKIPKFALPLMMTTILQLLYTAIDLWTVSKFGGGTLSMTSISSNNALINLIVTFLVSIATGANVCMGVAKGKNDSSGSKILHTALLVALIGGIAIGLFGFLCSPTFLSWMDTPADLYDNACVYIKIYFLGLPLSMVYNFGSQMLRAMGDSKRPFFISIIAGLLNVILDIILVLNGMDVAGVAIATIASQAISAILVILWLAYNKRGFVRFSFKELKIDKDSLKKILKIGVPAGLQGLAFCVPNLLIQSSLYEIKDYYVDGILIGQNEIVAGAGAASTIEGYIFAMLDTFAVAVVSFASTNYGARNISNIKKCYWYSIAWIMIFWSFAIAVSLTCWRALLSIFIHETTESGEKIIVENAILAGRERLLLMASTYFLDGIMDLDGNYLKGLKKPIPPALITLIGCTGFRIFFIFAIFPIESFHTIFWLYAAFPVSWTLVSIVYIPVILHTEKKTFKMIRDSINLNEKLA